MFKTVNSRVSLPEMEKRILELWKSKDIFKRSIEARKDGPRFMLYEGPPTANGSPGIHHVLSRAFKDIIPRYKVMKGYYAPRIGGWDTHGLPVELEIERKLGFTSKSQIEEYGIEKFNELCRNSVFGYLEDWNEITERIAYWVDLDNAYVTMNNSYIESVWWALKQMWDKGLIYQGYKVTPHCPRCGTSLSSHEVAQGYKEDTKDPSIYIKFKVVLSSLQGSEIREQLKERLTGTGKPAYLLAWTTTPWTLPGNTALAVAADAEYSVVELDNEYLIMATAMISAVGFEISQVVERVSGRDIAGDNGIKGLEYEPLFNPHHFDIERKRFQDHSELMVQEADDVLTYRAIATDFVSMEDGTGIVHVAPAYGEVDYEAGQQNELNFVHHVDLQGNIMGNYPFSGKFVKDADPLVLEDLEKKNLLFRSESILHTYPFCWRCDAPLLYYAKQTWYIKTTSVKNELLTNNDVINWYPEHIKNGRFGDWLQNNVDWAFSRERYWGTPLPLWYCQECGSYECVGGVDELKNKLGMKGMKEPLDMHRPYVDDITFECSKCGCTMQRAPEVIDCWFDSGSMPFAQLHYPFENDTMPEDGRFPADYICEAIDQTRGWFYSLHAISTLLFGKPCYKNVICLELILDAKGEKMSKSRGNVVEPGYILDKYGADALRWYCYTSGPPSNVRRFDEKIVAEMTRHFFLTLWNVYSFFVTYANIDKYVPGSEATVSEQPELDRWIMSELNQLILDVDSALENYNPTAAGRKLEEFVDGLSNWYVRRSRRRFWKSENDSDKATAYNTLYTCLVTLSKLLAPFAPFISEELYQNLVCSVDPGAPDSVHMADFPVADAGKVDENLSINTRLIMKISSQGRAARNRAGIKVRQPLEKVVVITGSRREKEGVEQLATQLLEELNVKSIEFADDVTSLDESAYSISSESNISVAMPKEISPELQAEGLAREIVHRLQTMRRSSGFDISDYIATYYQGDDYANQVMTDFAGYIKQETLSRELTPDIPEEDVHTETFKLVGHEVTLGVRRLP